MEQMHYHDKFMQASTACAKYTGTIQARAEMAYADGDYMLAIRYANVIIDALTGNEWFQHVPTWIKDAQRIKDLCELAIEQANRTNKQNNTNNQKAL